MKSAFSESDAELPPRPSRVETFKGRWLLLILALGLGVFSPAIQSPLFLDDYLHVAMVDGTFPGKRGPFDLYDFVNDADRTDLAARGLLPWWSDPQLTIRFFRPLSSALLWFAHRVTSHAPLLMHLHSLAWWLAAVLAVRALCRRFFSERASLIATAIFALSPCHALPLAWLANYETLIALAFGALGLSYQVRFRTRASGDTTRNAVLASFFFGLALLGGGEYALAFGGYILALEIAVRRRAILERARSVLPFAVPAMLYLAVRSARHYGAVGSGFYTDPLHEPLAFLGSAPIRLVTLLADSWLTLGADTWIRVWEQWALTGIVVAVAIALVVPIRRAFAELAPSSRTVASTMLWGSLFSLVPTLAVVPAFRLLGISMVGVAATSALVLEHVWFSPKRVIGAPSPSFEDHEARRVSALGTLVAILLAFTQLVHGPVTAFLASRIHRRDAYVFGLRAAWTRALVGEPARADVGVVRGLAGAFFLPFALDPHGRQPARWRVLSHGGHVLVLRRDENALELVVADDRSIYPIGEANLYRGPRSRLHAGDVVHRAGMKVTILEVGAIGPRRVRFEFDEGPAPATWMVEDVAAPNVVELPKVGEGAPFDP